MLIMYYILCDVKQNFEKILRGLLGGSAGGGEAGDDGDCEHKEEGNRGKPMPYVAVWNIKYLRIYAKLCWLFN